MIREAFEVVDFEKSESVDYAFAPRRAGVLRWLYHNALIITDTPHEDEWIDEGELNV
jgi:hypothetical protein